MKTMKSWREDVNCWSVALSVALLAMLAGLTCNPFAKKPSVPVVMGPDAGVAGVPLTFKATSEDPDGDSVAFMFDWGDTTTKVWTNYISSGETIPVSHTYADSDSYAVKARAQNGKGRESGWSGRHLLQLAGRGPGYPDSLVAEVQVPGHGRFNSMVVSPDGRFLYAALSFDTRVVVMRTADCVITDTVAVGSNPLDLVLSPDGSLLYIALEGADSVAVMRTSDDSITAAFHVGDGPRAMAITSLGDYLYVANAKEDTIAKVRTSDNVVVRRVASKAYPTGLVIDSHGNTLYVVCSVGGAVMKLALTNDSALGLIEIDQGLTAVGCNKDGDRLYVGDCSGRLFVVPVDMSVVTETLQLDGCVGDVAQTADGFYALIPTDEYHGAPVVRTDADEIVGWLTTEGLIGAVAVSPDGGRIYAGDDYRMRICVFERSGACVP